MKKLLFMVSTFVSFFAFAEQTNILASKSFSSCSFIGANGAIAHYQVNSNVYVNESQVENCPTHLVYKGSLDSAVIFQLAVVRTSNCIYFQANVGEVSCQPASK